MKKIFNKNKNYFKILSGSSSLIFLILIITAYFSINNMINSSDSIISLIGTFSWWILPFIIIDFFLQIIVDILIYINKKNYKVINIIKILLEVIYFIFTSVIVLPFIWLIFKDYSRIIIDLILLIFEIINLTLLIFTIKEHKKTN